MSRLTPSQRRSLAKGDKVELDISGETITISDGAGRSLDIKLGEATVTIEESTEQ